MERECEKFSRDFDYLNKQYHTLKEQNQLVVDKLSEKLKESETQKNIQEQQKTIIKK